MLIQPCVPDFFFLLFSGLFVMTIELKYFSCRTAISMGGVLHASAFMITAFAEDVLLEYSMWLLEYLEVTFGTILNQL